MAWNPVANSIREIALLAVTVLVTLAGGCHVGGDRRPTIAAQHMAWAPVSPRPFLTANEASASAHPLDFLKRCREHYVATVFDYRCRFHKRERHDGLLMPVEEMEVRSRETPYSVQMQWVRNARLAQRISYVAGRWVDGSRELALVHPSGWLGLLAPKGVKADIHSPLSRRAARGTIDQFGFRRTLDSIIRHCERARNEAEFDLRYLGRGTFNRRATFVFERRLPFSVTDTRYPDRLHIIHIDSEWLVPIACYSYADDEKKTLLGSYAMTAVEFNVGLTDGDF